MVEELRAALRDADPLATSVVVEASSLRDALERLATAEAECARLRGDYEVGCDEVRRLSDELATLKNASRAVLSALEFYDPDGDDETEEELNTAAGALDALLAGAPAVVPADGDDR
ncbi:MAG: hypothetical protein Q8S73_36670 [Deltaproteobacteria bacterium]|nr:hypothetical protein [Deltaproteobacteria bacterium]